jgi:hypothetical protein
MSNNEHAFKARVVEFYNQENQVLRRNEQKVKAREAQLLQQGEITPEDQCRLDIERAENQGRAVVLSGLSALVLTHGDLRPEDITGDQSTE